MKCPACSQEMSPQAFERHYTGTSTVDICHPCAALWFDTLEDLALTPGAVLRLFVVMNDNQPAQRNPLGSNLACPRCGVRLQLTTDMQRTTRFRYWRCPEEHGHFITFFEFLREKNFIRPLSPAEVEHLKQNVRTITCSSCGAPVDLNAGEACPYCRAALSMLDARQVEAVVQELKRDEARRQEGEKGVIDPDLAARLVHDRTVVERELGGLGGAPFGFELSGASGLVEAGVAALVALLKG